MSEVINRFERDHVELVDQAAVDTVSMIRSRLEELETDVAAETASHADIDAEIERMQRQIEWLQRVIDEGKRVVEIAAKAEAIRSVEMPFHGDVYVIFLGRLRGDSANPALGVKGWADPRIRVEVKVRAYDEDAAAARERVDSLDVRINGNAAQAIEAFDGQNGGTREQTVDKIRSRHADALPTVSSILDGAGPVLSLLVADNPHVSVEYGGQTHAGASVEVGPVTVFVPPMKTLRVVAGAARIEDVRADVEVVTHRGGGVYTDIAGNLPVIARNATGGTFLQTGTTHSAKRPEGDDQVTIARVGGDVRVETDNAPVRLWEVGGTIRARTVAADIEWMRTAETGVSMRIESDFGTIHTENAATEPQSNEWNWRGSPDPLYAATGSPDDTEDARIQLFTVAGRISVTNAE